MSDFPHHWVRAVAVADIPDGGAKSFAYLDKRIALFRTPAGVFASDNRCPHQGYALVRGEVKEGVLTCAWHNWKFELGTGTCRYGGENIRTYPVEIRDGQVFVDIADPRCGCSGSARRWPTWCARGSGSRRRARSTAGTTRWPR